MRNLKTVLIGALAIAALLGGRPAAADSGQPPFFASSCVSSELQAPEPLRLTGSGCYNQTLCQNDDYCEELCPQANSATCDNNVCTFVMPGGGGSGGGCPYQSLCVYDFHCVFPGGIPGVCVNNACVCN